MVKLIASKVGNNHGGNWVEEYTIQQEKTLRDEFAMAILIGDLASQSEESGFWDIATFDRCATRCYAMADAMMKARK